MQFYGIKGAFFSKTTRRTAPIFFFFFFPGFGGTTCIEKESTRPLMHLYEVNEDRKLLARFGWSGRAERFVNQHVAIKWLG